MARQPWKLTSILYPLMLAALLPLSLHDALAKLPDLTARLESPPDETAKLQLPLFRSTVRTQAKVRGRLNC